MYVREAEGAPSAAAHFGSHQPLLWRPCPLRRSDPSKIFENSLFKVLQAHLRLSSLVRELAVRFTASPPHAPPPQVPSNVNYVQSVRGVLGSPGWARLNSDRLTLDDGDNTFYVLIDDAQRVYIVVVSKAYPSRLIYDSADGKTEGFLSGGHSDLPRFAVRLTSSSLILAFYSLILVLS